MDFRSKIGALGAKVGFLQPHRVEETEHSDLRIDRAVDQTTSRFTRHCRSYRYGMNSISSPTPCSPHTKSVP